MADVTAAAQSLSGSTFGFQGAAAGHRIYFGTLRVDASGTLLKHWGGRVIQSVAASGGSFRFLFFSSATGGFEPMNVQAVNEAEGYRYADQVFLRASTEMIHFGLDSQSAWGTSVVDGTTAFWVCVEIVTPPAVLPVFETWWLLPSFSQSNDRGQNFHAGLSRFRQTAAAAGNVFGESGGVVTAFTPVGSGGLPTGWTHISPNSNINGDGNAIYHQFALPDGICTAFPINIRFVCVLQGGQPVTTAPVLICSFVACEVTGNLVADPAGGIVPVPRTLADTDTLTALAGDSDTVNVNGGAALPVDLSNRTLLSNFGPFDVSSRYEGDMVFVRLEMDSDGVPAQNTLALALIIEGVQFTEGSVI